MAELHPRHIIEKKQRGEKITMLTAYDYQTALVLDEVGIDMLLVGDSLGNVFSGFSNTLPVEMDHMVYHTQAVCRAAKSALVVGDMPFLSYQVSIEEAKRNAGRLVKEGFAHAVKLEIINPDLTVVSEIVNMGIPVMAHIGFTPQKLYQLGGYRVQGREQDDQELMVDVAKRLEEAGCFAVILEMVPADLATRISQMLRIPTIGIGAGPGCDGQVLVSQDMLGITSKAPRFVKRYVDISSQISTAVSQYIRDVQSGDFPSKDHSY